MGKTAFTAAALSAILLTSTSMADDRDYANFPITVTGYDGKASHSVSYSGQIARHVLHDSLKKIIGSGAGAADATTKAKAMAYFSEKPLGRAIVAPMTKASFPVAQTNVDEISKGKNLAGKIYKGAVAGMPNGMTGAELISFWIDKASTAKKGVDLANGYNYSQLVSKFIMGAVFYNQVVDKYLDETLGPDKKPNDKPYRAGAAYTGKEHAWDEAFGYFGAPAHTMSLTPRQVYEIAKMGKASKPQDAAFKAADRNGDGKVDLKTEMTFAPAYYAASFDASVYDTGKSTSYLHTIMKAFLDGRALLANAKGAKLSDAKRAELRGYAFVIGENWERVFAEAVFKYAGSVYKDMAKLKFILDANGDATKATTKYIKHWGELKGFSLALQTGKNNLGETATRMNRWVGYGPLLPNLSQVVDINQKGDYVLDQGAPWGEYMLHMAKIQKLMIETFGVKARNNDVTGEIAALTKSLGVSKSAEND